MLKFSGLTKLFCYFLSYFKFMSTKANCKINIMSFVGSNGCLPYEYINYLPIYGSLNYFSAQQIMTY